MPASGHVDHQPYLIAPSLCAILLGLFFLSCLYSNVIPSGKPSLITPLCSPQTPWDWFVVPFCMTGLFPLPMAGDFCTEEASATRMRENDSPSPTCLLRDLAHIPYISGSQQVHLHYGTIRPTLQGCREEKMRSQVLFLCLANLPIHCYYSTGVLEPARPRFASWLHHCLAVSLVLLQASHALVSSSVKQW